MVLCGGGPHLAPSEPPTATRPDALRQELGLICLQNKIPPTMNNESQTLHTTVVKIRYVLFFSLFLS